MNFSHHTILVVDDDKLFRKYITTIIVKHLKANVVGVGNPKEGFEYLKKNKPSLIILDMEMPLMDGYTALKLIRKINSTKDIPVIPCTAIRTKSMVLNLFKLDISDFIEKRTEPDIIVEKIAKVLVMLDEKS